MKSLLLLSIGLLLSITLFSQTIDNYFTKQQTADFQKLYLHTDREFYFMGDTLWFSPYLIGANSNRPLADACNLYVDLVNDKGESVEQKSFILENGMCSGYLFLDNKIIGAGTYTLRAHTDRMKPLGEATFFKKTIRINKVRQSNDEVAQNEYKEIITIDLYPEGGFLLEGKVNQIAFVAHNQNGKKNKLRGNLVVKDGVDIPLETSFNGMGSFVFVPHSNDNYKIVSDDYKNIRFKMPEIKEQGAKLMVSKTTSNAINLSIVASDNYPSNVFYVAVFHHGEGLNYMKVEGKNTSRPIKMRTNLLMTGVNRLVLLNADFEPLSERLVFKNSTDGVYRVDVDVNKKELKTREKVEINLKIPKIENNEEWARVSVSVVNKNMTGVNGNLLDIRSYLLLDSELKEQVQTPGLYFVDDDSISSARKLDLLMMTNGWRNYIWDFVKEKGDVDFPETVPGYSFRGYAQCEIANKPLIGTDVYLNIANDDLKELKLTKTDENGCFKFDSIAFYDSTYVIIQAINYKGKSNARIELATNGIDYVPVDLEKYKQPDDIGDLTFEMYRLKYINELTLKEFYPDRDSRVLEDIDVVAKKKEPKKDNHFRIYDNGFCTSRKITETERFGCQTIFQYLQGRFAGVYVSGEKVTIRGGSSITSSNTPLFLIDGMEVEREELVDLLMIDVDVVEILKGAEASIFGMRGGNGVISIFTRDPLDYNESRIIPGTILKKLKGFEKYRAFYSPVYTESNIDSKIPDYRQTLYWNPTILLENNSKKLSFFTCDNLTNYKVFVEGMTTSGKICMGEAEFTVDKRR